MSPFVRRSTAVIALVSMVALVGCSQQADDEAASRRQATQADVQAVMEALDATVAAGSLEYEARQDLASPAGDAQEQALTRTGKLDYERRLHEITVTGQGLPEIKAFFTEDRVFLQRGGGPWEELPEGAGSPLGDLESGDLLQFPAEGVLRTAALPGSSGQGGTRLTLQVAELEALSLLGGSFVQRVISTVGEANLVGEFDGELPAEIELDEEGRLRSAAIQLDSLIAHIGEVVSEPGLADLQFTYVLRLSRLGEALELTPPEPA